jgi:hypothetical protein
MSWWTTVTGEGATTSTCADTVAQASLSMLRNGVYVDFDDEVDAMRDIIARKNNAVQEMFKCLREQKMTQYLRQITNLTDDPYKIEWVKRTLGNYLEKNFNESSGDIEHVIDYIAQTSKRISKMSYPQAKANAQKWTKALIKKGDKALCGEAKTVMRLADGYSIVKLVDEESYRFEGNRMGHCVADYYGRESVSIYSLRDKDNQPHCTIEYRPEEKEVNQIKGKNNQHVPEKYHEYVWEFLEYADKYLGVKNLRNYEYVGLTTTSIPDLYEDPLIRGNYVSKSSKLKDGYVFDYNYAGGGGKIILSSDYARLLGRVPKIQFKDARTPKKQVAVAHNSENARYPNLEVCLEQLTITKSVRLDHLRRAGLITLNGDVDLIALSLEQVDEIIVLNRTKPLDLSAYEDVSITFEDSSCTVTLPQQIRSLSIDDNSHITVSNTVDKIRSVFVVSTSTLNLVTVNAIERMTINGGVQAEHFGTVMHIEAHETLEGIGRVDEIGIIKLHRDANIKNIGDIKECYVHSSNTRFADVGKIHQLNVSNSHSISGYYSISLSEEFMVQPPRQPRVTLDLCGVGAVKKLKVFLDVSIYGNDNIEEVKVMQRWSGSPPLCEIRGAQPSRELIDLRYPTASSSGNHFIVTEIT